jgi:protoporphyrinogen oxidase
MHNPDTAVIIGAGPAGLTAAYELLVRSDFKPIVVEMSEMMGGISRTVEFKGNRIDIGGHRFFSKSDRVMQWWLEMLPLEPGVEEEFSVRYQGKERVVAPASSRRPTDDPDRVMLVRSRKSRIFFNRAFFDYPIRLNLQTLRNLGFSRVVRIVVSYLKARVLPLREESDLEAFLINRFGRELYRTFFQSYTEKVWGVPCHEIGAEWGAQRIKGLSITKAVIHALSRVVKKDRTVSQRDTETSLIERFLYPKLGPGQMWETCAERVQELGGEIRTNLRVQSLKCDGNKILSVKAVDPRSGEKAEFQGDVFFSTMPVRNLIRGLGEGVPDSVREVAEGLIYRDFLTVGLLVDRLRIRDSDDGEDGLLKDNWIYIQEPDVLVGRIQIFNNWSPAMVADPDLVWLGMEYFCNETDDLWGLSDEDLKKLGAEELERLGFIDAGAVREATVIRMPKTYPAYFGTYDRFGEIREYLDSIENLFLVGRNGMHRYNNQDHSMLTAMTVVDNLLAGSWEKGNVWDVNVEQEYHESK